MIKRAGNFGGALLLLCLSLTADAAENQGTITLTDSKKIADAMAKAGGALLTLWITWKNKNKES